MGAEPVHFDIPADDPDRLADFYTKVLGWTIDAPQDEYDGYRMIRTSDREGSVGGGMYKKMAPEQAGINYYGVDSIEETVGLVRENGGQVVMEMMTVPKMGYFAVLLDPEGNPFGLWIEDENAA